MSVNQFHQLRILCPGWQGYSLEFQCPLIWTMNQIKCYVTYISPKLNFHQFQITFAGKVIPGTRRLQQIVQGKKEKDRTVLFLSSKPAEKFEQYYAERMKRFFEGIEQEMAQMHAMGHDNMLEGVPILSNHFNATMNMITQIEGKPQQDNHLPQPANNAEQARRANAEDGEEGEGLQLGGIIDRFIVIGVLWMSWMQGSYTQIVCISVLLILHEIVTRRRKNNNNRQENAAEGQQPPVYNPGKLQRALKLRWFQLREFFYCYFMSLFPNWNVQRDYLEKFRNDIERTRVQTQQPPVVANPVPDPQQAQQQPLQQQLVQ